MSLRPFALAPALAVALALPVTVRAGSPAEAARAAAATITEARCGAHVQFLASDLLARRATPSRGLDVAGEYIRSHFVRLGLEAGGPKGEWFQGFPVLREIRLKSSALAAGERSFKLGDDYVPLPMTAAGKAEGAVVFAGYGISA